MLYIGYWTNWRTRRKIYLPFSCYLKEYYKDSNYNFTSSNNNFYYLFDNKELIPIDINNPLVKKIVNFLNTTKVNLPKLEQDFVKNKELPSLFQIKYINNSRIKIINLTALFYLKKFFIEQKDNFLNTPLQYFYRIFFEYKVAQLHQYHNIVLSLVLKKGQFFFINETGYYFDDDEYREINKIYTGFFNYDINKNFLNYSLEKAPILIYGASGIGKTTLAYNIHYNSSYKDYPLVFLDAALFRKEYFDLEFFGAQKGSFTGSENKKGILQYIKKGTIVIQNIEMLDEAIQLKLLPILQKNQYKIIGDNKFYEHNVRFIFISADKNMKYKLRRDFFYTIETYKIILPEFKYRYQDIEEFINFYYIRTIKEINSLLQFRLKEFVSLVEKNYLWLLKFIKKVIPVYNWHLCKNDARNIFLNTNLTKPLNLYPKNKLKYLIKQHLLYKKTHNSRNILDKLKYIYFRYN